MLRRLILGVVVIGLLVLSTSHIAYADGTGVGCGNAGCGVGAVDAGSGGSTGSTGSGATSTGSGGGTGAPPALTCSIEPMSPQPSPDSPWWGSGSAATGVVVQYVCPAGLDAGIATPFFQPFSTPTAPVAVDPVVLAQAAYQKLPIPQPNMAFGPDVSRIAVRYWTYLWVSNSAPVTASATAGAVTVTATASLKSVIWTMGEPVSADRLFVPAPPLVCQGPGSDPGPNVNTTLPPAVGACAYMFNVRSTAERTGGARTWPVTAAASWVITWRANTGESGTLDAPVRVSTTGVCVGAWSSVEVADGYVPAQRTCLASG